ncbi:RAVE subunit 2/Rogdi [Diplogelasinospora grovesii]|uniref:RAVE subunit 2/Rogdi n=1 Tax=Diplogelasinospora grovesii TaxID=303347 RepID=A0AAN6S424_9PEZI|nr:RAVE subunit 2/Rogdi [Diplogelasinospora grovesii]
MSIAIWPPIAPGELKIAVETTQKREIDWFVQELHETLSNLQHGLEDCYALLAPIDPGSTLVLSTPRHEFVKGHITRVGTRIVKGTIHLRLRTLPHQTLTINPDHPIHLGPLMSLHSLLTHAIDLLGLTLSYSYPSSTTATYTSVNTRLARAPESSADAVSSPHFLAAQLRLLAQTLSEASALLKGPPLAVADPSWTTRSVAPSHFVPPLPQPHGSPTPPLSFHLAIQDSSLVLWLRSLEPADAPVHFGTKLALAIGTARRLEHDEADRVFGFCCSPGGDSDKGAAAPSSASLRSGCSGQIGGHGGREVEVYVREKVRVESADPSLLSLSAKLAALSHTLGLARRNLAAVMGEEGELGEY